MGNEQGQCFFGILPCKTLLAVCQIGVGGSPRILVSNLLENGTLSLRTYTFARKQFAKATGLK